MTKQNFNTFLIATIFLLLPHLIQANSYCVTPGQEFILPSNHTGAMAITLCPGNEGNNANIVINGQDRYYSAFEDVGAYSTWQPVAGTPLYKAQVPGHINQLFDKRLGSTTLERMDIARSRAASGSLYSEFQALVNFENDPNYGGYLAIDPVEAQQIANEAGARLVEPLFIVVRTDNWRFVRREVGAFLKDQGLIYFKGEKIESAEGGLPETNGYFIANTQPIQPGQWSHINGELYYYPINSQSLSEVKIIRSQSAVTNSISESLLNIDLGNFAGALTIISTNLIGSAGNGLSIQSQGPVTVHDVAVSHAGEHGIYVQTLNRGVLVQYSYVADSQTSGIVSIALDSVMKYNRIYNNGRLGSQANPDLYLAGIVVAPTGHYGFGRDIDITSNDIRGTGGDGISFSQSGNSVKVIGNYVKDSCLVKNDCAGIYLSSNNLNPSPYAHYEIAHNQVFDVYGEWSGKLGAYAQRMTAGIYFDFCASGFTIHHNWITGAYNDGEVLSNIFGFGVNSLSNNNTGSTYMGQGNAPSLCHFL